MKTIKLLNIVILISLFFVGIIKVHSQTVTIGDGSSANGKDSWPAPYGNYEYGARFQIIVDASELAAAGAISGNVTAIGFDVSSVNDCPSLTNFAVRIGNSPKTNFESSNSWITDLTTVSSSSYQPVTGWNIHNFDNSFYWDGSSDIVIETCFYNGTYGYNASTKYTETGQKMVVGSEGSFDPCSNSTTAYPYNERPNIKLYMQTNTAIDDIDISSEISLYPNPVNKNIFIKIHNNSDKIEQLSIFNSIGQIIYMEKERNKNNRKITIDISDYKAGLYFIKLKTENRIIIKKFIKQNR